MKTLNEIHNSYEDYLEYMHACGRRSSAFTFEDWIDWQLDERKLTQQEHELCFDSEGYLREPKFRCDHD